MAQKVVTILSDDLDGSEATETIRFSLDNSEYEIDLNEGHANELRRALERFTNAGRKVSGGRGRPAARSKSSQGGPEAKAIRLWAAEQGLQVNTRGRIQAEIVEKYEAAH
ncbi:Lsr2 family protein [Arthrobacter sp. ISL-85]|uniref:histone-like nucleoid-structuring protein Lsr2 n=1 Tax=Arthrobacter sp. ISL-85 TaxID=2819115 RepID=UPI001BE5DECB|nr:Lsr2 family protein [Arthrobacter sp. ISL-85]MBT2565266.1 Lsr2 family protein [Arthrobacter sp. ISL-85]